MKEWIKIEANLFEHDEIRKLWKEYSYKGLVIYFLARIFIEKHVEGYVHINELEEYLNQYASRSILMKVVSGYCLFDVDEEGSISTRDLAYGHTQAHTDAHTDAHTSAHTQAHTSGPLSEKNLEKENNKEREDAVAATSEEAEEEEAFLLGFKEHYPTLGRMKAPLTLKEYKKLLERGYTCNAIIDKLQRMENYPNIEKRYKNVYLTLNNWLK